MNTISHLARTASGLLLALSGCQDDVSSMELLVQPGALARDARDADDTPAAAASGFRLGGTVSGLEAGGLTGSGLVLTSLVGDLALEADGSFAFEPRLATGRAYDVSVKAHPNDPFQLCSVARGRGSIADRDVDEVTVTCVQQPDIVGLDASFGSGGRVTTPVGSNDGGLALQPDGKIVLVGGSASDFLVARYDADGRLDPSFGSGGTVSTDLGKNQDDRAYAVALQPDGKLVVVGEAAVGRTRRDQLDYDFALARFDADGNLDQSFGNAGSVTTDFFGERDQAFAVVIQKDGKIVVAGGAAFDTPNGDGIDFALARYEADGSLDKSFNVVGWLTTSIARVGQAQNLALLEDGALLVSGPLALGPDTNFDHTGLARCDASGTLDPRFGVGGMLVLPYLRTGEGLALQGDGKLVLAGAGRPGSSSDFALLRLNADGTPDEDFGDTGLVTSAFGAGNAVAHAVTLQADGKLVVVGSHTLESNTDFALARYAANGELDAGFGNAGFGNAGQLGVDYFGALDTAQHVAVQPDGKLVVGGFVQNGLVTGFGLARVLP
jgi:uncharacterized delta-60 repeat protein